MAAGRKSASSDPRQEVTLRITGRTPLLMHNIRLANPLDPIARAMKAVNSSKKQLTVEEHAEQMAALEFEGGLYWDDDLGVYLPGYNVFKSIVEGGRMSKNGTAITQAVLDYTEKCPVLYPGKRHKTIKSLWESGEYYSTVAVKVGTAKVMRTRPQFVSWETDFTAVIDTTILTKEAFVASAEMAGLYKGVGDGRTNGYGKGRFDVTVV